MIVVLCGAPGKSGSRLLKELWSREDQVKAVVREPRDRSRPTA
jgi:putative NADH-flavin reductase